MPAISLATKTLQLAPGAFGVKVSLPPAPTPKISTATPVRAPLTVPVNFGVKVSLPTVQPAANTILQVKTLKDPAINQALAAEAWKHQVSAPGYQPTTADILAASSYGLLDWFHTLFPPHPNPAEVASADLAGDLASNAFNPNETLDNYSDLVAAHTDTGHVVSKQEVRTYYVHFYNSLAAEIGL